MTFSPLIVNALKADEGFAAHPYKDSVGRTTIGWGRNLDANPLTPDEAAYLMQNDIARAVAGLNNALPWWTTLNEVRQAVLINMAFNLGIQSLLVFHHMLDAAKAGNFIEAAAQMRNSKWYGQVGDRAMRLADEMDTGELA